MRHVLPEMNLLYRSTQVVDLLRHKQISLLWCVCRRAICFKLHPLYIGINNKTSNSKKCVLTNHVHSVSESRSFRRRHCNAGVGLSQNSKSGGCGLHKHILLASRTGTKPKLKVSNWLYSVCCFSDSSDSNNIHVIDDPDLKKIVKQISKDFEEEKTGQEAGAATDTDSGSDTEDSDNSNGDVDTSNQGTTKVESHSDPPKDVTQSKVDQATIYSDETNTDTEIIFEDEVNDTGLQELIYEEFDDEQEAKEEEFQKPVAIDLQRGEAGVYDIGDIVTLLRDENLGDLCVIRVPEHLRYVDYLVLATGKSFRQLRATAELLKHIYKKRREKRDPASVKIEGMQSTNWLAMDFGNIAVHLFLHDTRELYDLETLWTVGEAFDRQSQEEVDPFALSRPSFALEDTVTDWFDRTESQIDLSKDTDLQSDDAWREGSLETFTDWHKRHP